MAQNDHVFKNILVIHFGQLGDVVLGLPVLSAIRERFADSKITLMVGKAPAEITRLADIADDYLVVDRVQLRDGNKLRSIAETFRITAEVRRRGFDLVIDLHSLYETNLLGFVTGIPNRLYANRESRSIDLLSNFRPRPPREDKSRHATDKYFDVVSPLGIQMDVTSYRLNPRDADLEAVNGKFQDVFAIDGEPLAGLFPGAGNPSRCWPLGNFSLLADLLVDAGIRPVVFLGPEEADLRSEIDGSFPETTAIVDGLTLPQFVAAVSKVEVFVANDTGPIHLAACSGVSVVLLLDERAPTTYLPRADKLKVIRDRTIDKIDVENVHRAVMDTL